MPYPYPWLAKLKKFLLSALPGIVSRSQTLSSFIGKSLVDYNIPIWFSRPPLWLALGLAVD